ncbi:unnamed protein product, partial [Closterium sp. NIES-54]
PLVASCGPLAAPCSLRAALWQPARRPLQPACRPLAARAPSSGSPPAALFAGLPSSALPCLAMPTSLMLTLPYLYAALPVARHPALPAMASLSVLTFDHEGRPIQFDTWLDDLQLYVLSDSRDIVSLFDHTSGASLAPPATADSVTRSHWLTLTVGAARGTPRTPFFEGCSPSPLAPSYASAATVDILGAEDVGAPSALSGKRHSSKGKGGKSGGGGSRGGGGVGGGGGGGGGSGGSGGGSGGLGGGGGGSGGGGGGGGGSSGSGGGGSGGGRGGAVQRGGSVGGQMQQQ